jgi:hypothetical protein
MGVLINTHETTIIVLPTIAFKSPPPVEPAAGVLFKKKSKFIAAAPLETNTNKIQARMNMPKIIAIIERVNPTKLDLFLRL